MKHILNILRKVQRNIGALTTQYHTSHILYYRNSGGRYWKIITDYQPKFFLNGDQTSSSRESYLFLSKNDDLKVVVSILNSTLYYWYYVMHSDARTNNPSDLKDFPLDIRPFSSNTKKNLMTLCDCLMGDIDRNSVMQNANYRTGSVEFQQFFVQYSKPIIDKIDKAFKGSKKNA